MNVAKDVDCIYVKKTQEIGFLGKRKRIEELWPGHIIALVDLSLGSILSKHRRSTEERWEYRLDKVEENFNSIGKSQYRNPPVYEQGRAKQIVKN